MATRNKTVLARDIYLALVRAQDRLVGQAADLVKDIPPAGEIVTRMVSEAEAALNRYSGK